MLVNFFTKSSPYIKHQITFIPSCSAFSFILKGRKEFRFKKKPPFQSLTYLTTRVEGDTVSRQPPFPADAPEALARLRGGEGRDGRTVGAGEGGEICDRGGWSGVQMETGDEVAEGHRRGQRAGEEQWHNKSLTHVKGVNKNLFGFLQITVDQRSSFRTVKVIFHLRN